MAEETSIFPFREPVVRREDLIVNERWRIWFRDLHQQVNLGPVRLAQVSLAAQNASISATAFDTAALAEGQYRVSTFFKVDTAAGATSSLQVTIGFTRNGVACTQTGTARTTNTTATVDSNTWFISIDDATPITYATTYASNPAAAMQYSIDVVLEIVATA